MSAPAADDTGVHNLKSLAEYKSALEMPGVMAIDAYATWCGPCKVIAPVVVQYAKKYGNVRFYKVDVDEVPDVAQELGIRAMPTVKIFKNGEEFETVVGANPPAIESAVAKASSL